MSIANQPSFHNRPRAGGVRCRCRAIAGYRLTNGSRTIYACPFCASQYANDEWQAEALPHIRAQYEALAREATS